MQANGSDRAVVVEFMEDNLPEATIEASYPIILDPYSFQRGYLIKFKTPENDNSRFYVVKSVKGVGLELVREHIKEEHRHPDYFLAGNRPAH